MIGSISGLRIDQNLIPWDDLKLQGELPRKLYFPGDVNLDLAAPVLLGPNGAKLGRSDSAGGQTVAPTGQYSSLVFDVIAPDGTLQQNIPAIPTFNGGAKIQKSLYTAQTIAATTTSADINIGGHALIALLLQVTAISGAGAGIQPTLDVRSNDGTWYSQVGQMTNVNAVQAVGSTSSFTPRGKIIRLRLIVVGTTPSITFNLDYILN